ncbi:MAG TPA: Clp protease N-terminal domain-containing protein [Jiangellaceae bacterium]|nr:Clp protease N-terminal domain-containing protein [Jiangellaceae bacterium]
MNVGSGHLLLTLIHEGQGVAPQVVINLGATLVDVETDVLQQLPEPDGDTQASLRQRGLWAQQSQTAAELAARLDSGHDQCAGGSKSMRTSMVR